MPQLGFKPEFVPKIENGSKVHTIRRKRKRPIKVGDTLYLLTGMRTKQCRRVKVVKCTMVWGIKIKHEPRAVEFDSGGHWHYSLEALVKNDGFDSIEEFFNWFVSKKEPVFEGQLIWWV